MRKPVEQENKDPVSVLSLDNYISYDEMALSALLTMSTPSFFINDGDRGNRGILDSVDIDGNRQKFEPVGIYVGQVGARFERMRCMEWRHMIVTEEQNTEENGYGKANFETYIREVKPKLVKNDREASSNLGLSDLPQMGADGCILNMWADFYQLEDGFPLFADVNKDSGASKHVVPRATAFKGRSATVSHFGTFVRRDGPKAS